MDNNHDNINLNYINNRIEKEICYDTINKLSDTYLINKYTKCKSIQNNSKKLKLILEKYNIDSEIKELIINLN